MVAKSDVLYPPGAEPAPPSAPLPSARYLLRFLRNPLSVMPQQVYEEPILRHGRRAWVCDPVLVKTVLLDARETFPKTGIEARVFGGLLGQGILIAEDHAWKWQRQAAAPLFRAADILQYVPQMSRAADALLARWRTAAAGSLQPIDRQMTEITFEVIADTMLAGEDGRGAPGLAHTNNDYMAPLAWPLLWAMLRLPRSMPFPGRTAHLRAERGMRVAVEKIVKARRSSALPPRADLLRRLLEARDAESGQLMGDAQATDNLLTFLLAGHETTARNLAWALYLVAQCPAWEARLLEEVRTVAGDEPIMAAHVERLRVTTAFVKETMRLYPPISSVSRIAAHDTVLGGVEIPAETLLIIPMFAIHRHRKLWCDPDRFDPGRFLDGSDVSRYQYMPFGAGPRICIGAAFSMTEAVVMLAAFVRAMRFAVPQGRRFTPVSGITLRARPEITLEVTPRA